MTVKADIMALIWSAILAERFGSTFLAIWHSPSSAANQGVAVGTAFKHGFNLLTRQQIYGTIP